MSKPEGYVPSRDTTMNELYSLALGLGPCPPLPDSLKNVHNAATFLHYADENIIPFYRTLKKEDFILKVGDLARAKIPDVGSFASTTREHQLIGSQMVDDENKWRVEYLTNVVGIQESYNIVVLNMNEDAGKLYRLHYEMDPLKAPEQMPIANQTIDSFRFLK
jgi:hypothetical protein